MSLLAEIQFGREVCGDLDAAEAREWLVTNGIGGFASGTVAGTATRRYHGLLVAALQPPVARTVLVSGLDESVRYLDASYSLATNRWTQRIHFAKLATCNWKVFTWKVPSRSGVTLWLMRSSKSACG